MSAERFNDDLRELVPGMRIRQAVTAARLNALTALARDANRGSMIRGGPGLRVSSGPQGVTVRARKPLPRAGGGVCKYAWTPTKTGNDGAGNDLLTLNVGGVSAGGGPATVKIDGVNILTNPTLEVPDTADTTQIVYLDIPVTKVKTANDFVYGCTVTGGVATVEVATELPPSSQTTRYVELFRWRNGALFNQLGKYNVLIAVRDDGTSTNVGVFEHKTSA